MSDTSLIFTVLGRDRASAVLGRVATAAKVAFAIAATAVAAFAVSSVKAYAEAQTAQAKLTDAYERFPGLADTNIDALRQLNSELAKKTRFDDDATATGQAVLAQFKLTGSQVQALTPLMQDFAAKTGKDLPSAAEALGKALLGQGRGLKAIGVNFKDTGSLSGNYAALMDVLRDKVGGFAEKEGKTAAGQAAILENQFGELKEQTGEMLLPSLMKLVGVLREVVDFTQRNHRVIVPLVAILGGAATVIYAIVLATKAWTAVQIALNIAMSLNPLGLIIIAIVAVIAVIVILWMKSAAFRNFFINAWRAIWGFLKGIGAWFAGPFKQFFVNAWNGAILALRKMNTFIINTFNSVVNFVKSLPGRIAAGARGMWNGIVAAFKAAVNTLIRLWNNFSLTLGGGTVLGVSIPSITLGTPDLPYLDTGGSVLRTGLAVVHRGEEVTPAAVVSRRGGEGGGRTVLEFVPSGRRLEDLLLELIRDLVRVRGGGDVQRAFGR